MHRTLLPLTFVLALAAPGRATDLTATGDWARTIGAGDLQAGAGSDLVETYESAEASALLAISNTGGAVWRVDVRRTDTTWHGNFALLLRRTGDGMGGGPISGGAAYQAIGETNAEFFSGTGDRTNIPVQFELAGMSVQIPPNTYVTTITYTVVQL